MADVSEIRRALITGKTSLMARSGITGEIGSLLTEFLLDKDYEVHGIVRNPDAIATTYSYHKVFQRAVLHTGDLRDGDQVTSVLQKVRPHEIYNLGASTQVQGSWEDPGMTMDTNFLGLVRILDAICKGGLQSETRLLQMFGQVEKLPIGEDTPIAPRTPYATSKAACHWIVQNYRSKYDIFAVNAIMFNHESERRGTAFATYQLTEGVSQVVLGTKSHVQMGDLDLVRDWGHALDGIECMWLSLQHDVPDNYVLATGTGHTAREFAEASFASLGVKLSWQGTGADEVGIESATGKVVVRIDAEAYGLRSQSNSQVGDP